jgi:Fe-Mn family superoxide dismutase
MKFQLLPLPYDYAAYEPHFDKETMRIHHTKHHQGYTDKLNKAILGTELEGMTIEAILSEVSKHSDAVRNNAGGFFNHNLFWMILSPKGSEKPKEGSDIHKAILRKYGHFEEFRKALEQSALGRFGSGWAWLCVDHDSGELFVTSTPNQDNPLMDLAERQGVPILGVDVWEHAYYLKYQNRRADYLNAFFQLIDWPIVDNLYKAAHKEAVAA